MGRHSTRHDFSGCKRFAVSRPAGEYDSGGAYWGLGFEDGPVWAVWEAGKASEGVAYVRAHSRLGAIRSVMES